MVYYKLIYLIVLSTTIIITKQKKLELEVSHYVYLTIKLNKDEIGYIKIDLYESIVPKTVMNFLTICKGVKFSQKNEDLLMSYTNVRIHKVRPGHLLETGDFLYHSGYGHESIYGPQFEDENFILKHRKYSVGMVNTGPHTNGGQFYITLEKNAITKAMDGTNVVFGYVNDKKSQKVLKLIEKLGDYEEGKEHLQDNRIYISVCSILNRNGTDYTTI